MNQSADGFHYADSGGDLGDALFGVEAGFFYGAGEESYDGVEMSEDGGGDSAGDVGAGLGGVDEGFEFVAELVKLGGRRGVHGGDVAEGGDLGHAVGAGDGEDQGLALGVEGGDADAGGFLEAHEVVH